MNKETENFIKVFKKCADIYIVIDKYIVKRKKGKIMGVETFLSHTVHKNTAVNKQSNDSQVKDFVYKAWNKLKSWLF